MAYEPWSDSERDFLMAVRKNMPDATWKEIGQIMNRSPGSCSFYYRHPREGRGGAEARRPPPTRRRRASFMLSGETET